MPDQRDVQQLIQSLTPSAVNNGNPNTVYNQPQPQGGYIPPTFDPGTNTWRINPAPAPSTVNWQQMSASQPQAWGWQQPAQPAPIPQPNGPMPTTPTTPIPTTPTPVPPGSTVGGYNNGASMNSDDSGFRVAGNAATEGCVVVNTYLQDFDRADQVEVGDEMFVVDPISYKKSVGRVSYSTTKLMPCVRITTENGIVLECSTTAPIADERGEQVLAPDLLHKLIPVCDNGMFYLDRVETIEDIGEQEVRHITVEDNFFLAGKEKGRYIFHHNMKMGPGSYIPYDSGGMDFMFAQDFGGRGAEGMGAGAIQSQAARNAAAGIETGGGWNGSLTGNESSNPFAGAGLNEAFGAPGSPTNGSGYMSNPFSGTGTSPVSNWNTSWMQDMPANAGGITDLPAVQAEAPKEQGFWGNLWDKVKQPVLTALDWVVNGNLYHSDTGEVAPFGAWIAGAADSLLGTGGLATKSWDMYGKSELKDGYDPTGSAERSAIGALQYQYQQATPQQQQKMLESMTKPGSGYPQSVIDAVTGSGSYWQGTR